MISDIRNSIRNTVIAKEYNICSSSLSKGLGLMFRFKPKTLVFEFKKEQKVPLHMMFVFFPIDVLFLDNKGKVVEMKENFKPFRFYNPKHKCSKIIELPAKSIKKSKTKIGDKVIIN